MEEATRVYFLAFYASGLPAFSIKVIPAGLGAPPPEQQAHGVARLLPPILILFNFILPPLLLLFRVGKLNARWLLVRGLGVSMSLYAALMLLWASATLGRFLVPQAVVQSDHKLVEASPYRFLRHPAYSGDLALWFGATLGTTNFLLLCLWPLSVLGTYLQMSQEETLLASKFGTAYESYARRTGRLVLWVRVPRNAPLSNAALAGGVRTDDVSRTARRSKAVAERRRVGAVFAALSAWTLFHLDRLYRALSAMSPWRAPAKRKATWRAGGVVGEPRERAIGLLPGSRKAR